MEMETSGNSGIDHLSGHRTQGGSATERQGQRCDRSLTEHHSPRAEAEAPLGLLCCNALSFLPWSLAPPASGCGTVGPHLLLFALAASWPCHLSSALNSLGAQTTGPFSATSVLQHPAYFRHSFNVQDRKQEKRGGKLQGHCPYGI